MNNIPQHVKSILAKLCKAGFESFLVGGVTRDFFDDKIPNDFDVVTKATPAEIENVFQGERVDTVGKSFGVTIVNGIEIATFRTDHYPAGNGAKQCVTRFAQSIHEDLSRRDLTINALALCPISGDVIDDFGGREDLRNRVIRFVGNADARIVEDPNRIVRACRFVAKLEGSFDIDTLFALRRNAHLVQTHVDPERIAKEILKAMELDHPSLFFAALHTIGALKFIFPEMDNCVGHWHGVHHAETVWDHIMLAGDSVSPRFPLVRLAAFLHDIGKPGAFKFHADGSFIGHEMVGAAAADTCLRKLRFSTADREKIVNLVEIHMLGATPGMTAKAVRKFRKTLNDKGLTPQDWLRVRIADRKSNLRKEKFSFGDIRYRRSVFVDVEAPLPFTVNSLALRGGDLIEIFRLTPGPIVGQLQRHLLDFVLDNGAEFNTREALELEARVHLA